MLKSQVLQNHSVLFVNPNQNPLLLSNNANKAVILPRSSKPPSWQRPNKGIADHRLRSPVVKASSVDASLSEKKAVSVKVVVTLLRRTISEGLYLERGFDDIADLFGKSLILELVSSELDPGQ